MISIARWHTFCEIIPFSRVKLFFSSFASFAGWGLHLRSWACACISAGRPLTSRRSFFTFMVLWWCCGSDFHFGGLVFAFLPNDEERVLFDVEINPLVFGHLWYLVVPVVHETLDWFGGSFFCCGYFPPRDHAFGWLGASIVGGRVWFCPIWG